MESWPKSWDQVPAGLGALFQPPSTISPEEFTGLTPDQRKLYPFKVSEGVMFSSNYPLLESRKIGFYLTEEHFWEVFFDYSLHEHVGWYLLTERENRLNQSKRNHPESWRQK